METMRLFLAALLFVGVATAAHAETLRAASPHDFETTVARLEAAVAANGLFLVATASASRAAAGQGIAIPGNAVLLVFNNAFARRMLAASVEAGIEAPLRIYVTQRADGRIAVAWPRPASVFAPYKSAALDAMAAELDALFERIVADAVGMK
ncbi:MAG: DUF302 domain-containing protein [Rhodospirillales bacterium]|jgi:uncharacterized protein (DUF302 family)